METQKIITLAFLDINYLYKVMCNDNNFYHFLSCVNLKHFDSVKDAIKVGKSMDIKNLKVVEIDYLHNVKTLKYIN
jgi:hypothetical protein